MKKSLIPFKYQVSIYEVFSCSGFPDKIFFFDDYDSVKDFLSCNDFSALVFELNPETFLYDRLVGQTRVVYEESVNE